MKPKRWVQQKYFPTVGGRRWCFTGYIVRADGTQAQVVLLRAADLPIRRHVLVKGDANPFDPKWTEYYRQRRQRRSQELFRDRRRFGTGPRSTFDATSSATGGSGEA